MNDHLCDVTLIVNETRIRAHRSVLAESCRYFQTMFTLDWAEKNQPEIDLSESLENGQDLHQLVQYIYTGELDLNHTIMDSMFYMADFFGLEKMKKYCCWFLEQNIRSYNVLSSWTVARRHSCDALASKLFNLICAHFQLVCEKREFVDLDYDGLLLLVQNDRLRAYDEKALYNSVMKWLKFDIQDRIQHIRHLLESIKWKLMNNSYILDTVINEKLINEDHETKEWFDSLLSREENARQPLPSGRHFRTRRPFAERPFVIIDGEASHVFLENTKKSLLWGVVEPTLVHRRNACSAVLANGTQLYVVGGNGGYFELGCGELYNPITNTWSMIASMNSKRSCFCMTELNGWMYAAGGVLEKGCLESVEKYEPIADRWIRMPSMLKRRESASLVGSNGSLYVMGGLSKSRRPLASTGRFDPREGKWYECEPMINARYKMGALASNQSIYVSGGCDQHRSIDTVERFDLRTNTWQERAPLNESRFGHNMMEFKEHFCIIGGHSGGYMQSETMEVYDPVEDEWTLSLDRIRIHPISTSVNLVFTNAPKAL